MHYRNSRSHYFGTLAGIAVSIIFISSLFWPAVAVFGQTVTDDVTARRVKLEAELAAVNKEIEAQNKLLSAKQKESASLERDRSLLNYRIATAKLNIKAKQIEIQRISGDIDKKEITIGDLTSKVEREKQSLAELLRKTKDIDNTSIIEIALADNNFSDLFADISSFRYIQTSMHQSFNTIQTSKQETQKEKVQLEGRRDSTMDAKKSIEQENAKVVALEKQKKDLLALSKNQESNYKKVIADRQAKKNTILSALFQLRDSGSIPFEKALAYAKEISVKTGVRPAFILAILTQETNLGENVGRCNRPGDPVSKSWKSIMKPERDYEPFLRIVKALGLDPDAVPLSCAQAGGYGGAMGPSQFIPSTWELYEDRITAVTGNNPPNPWNAEDAFAATGLFLKDLGGIGGAYTAEFKAAAKYYAGSRWQTSGQAYGTSVMSHAATIQKNIDYLQNN